MWLPQACGISACRACCDASYWTPAIARGFHHAGALSFLWPGLGEEDSASWHKDHKYGCKLRTEFLILPAKQDQPYLIIPCKWVVSSVVLSPLLPPLAHSVPGPKAEELRRELQRYEKRLAAQRSVRPAHLDEAKAWQVVLWLPQACPRQSHQLNLSASDQLDLRPARAWPVDMQEHAQSKHPVSMPR
jgi:hypothetical protein